jgi:hypothetical protein
MQVNGVTSQINSILPTKNPPPKEPQVRPIEEQPDVSESVELNVTQSEESSDNGTKGVIRNLLDGHYKGVADVRLRIVHYEELAAIENGQLKATAETEVEGLLSTIKNAVSGIPELNEPVVPEGEETVESSGATVAGLQNEFADAVNNLLNEFESAQSPSTSGLISGIKNVFADFVASLQSLLVPPVEESPLEEDPPVEENPPAEENPPVEESPPTEEGGDAVEGLAAEGEDGPLYEIYPVLPTETEAPAAPETEPTIGEVPPEGEPEPLAAPTPPAESVTLAVPTGPDYQSLIDELSGVFEAALADLTKALSGSQVLPELSEPSGSGRAYQKFLQIYNNLWSIGPGNEGAESLNAVT